MSLHRFRQREIVAHGQRLEQVLHDLFGDRADIHSRDELQNLLQLVLRHAVAAQAERQEGFQLLLERQRLIARMGHIAPHEPRRAELQRIKILRRERRLVRPEDLIQLSGCLAEDIFRGFALRIGLDVDLAQILVQLRQRDLQSSLDGIDEHGRQLRPGCLPRGAELIGEHEADQLGQHAVLGAENVLKAAVGDLCLLDDLRDGRLFVALLQKQLDADLQDPPLCRQACIGECDRKHSLSFFFTL